MLSGTPEPLGPWPCLGPRFAWETFVEIRLVAMKDNAMLRGCSCNLDRYLDVGIPAGW